MSNAFDSSRGYGWISIALHWLAASIILTLWFIGDSTKSEVLREQLGYWGQIHVSLALSAYGLLLFRIVWRLKSGHPRLEGQGRFSHLAGKIAHYAMLVLLALMLLSGPFMRWSVGADLVVFGWLHIPSPTGYVDWLVYPVRRVHQLASTGLIILIGLHICGACKHLMFNDDETFVRILFPKKKP